MLHHQCQLPRVVYFVEKLQNAVFERDYVLYLTEVRVPQAKLLLANLLNRIDDQLVPCLEFVHGQSYLVVAELPKVPEIVFLGQLCD